MALQPGLQFEFRYEVPRKALVPVLFDDIEAARALPPVLATGYMAGIMECACLDAIRPHTDWPAQQSVGTLVSFSHLAATVAGDTVTVRGTLVGVEGRKLVFEVEAHDGAEKIAEGRHERVLIDAARFREKVAAKAQRQGLALE
ncbi:thioesterase family protein [Orrella sp. JC864]|uniref:thioesterase family protein n=1 Tax=Orrella sp. JC864 TaxID=3120298 RepID=UPI0012BB64D5